MVGLVVEAPLADDEVRARVLHLLDHVLELFRLVRLQLLVLLDRGDVELVLRLGPWRFERARQDRDPRVRERARHLRVRHVLVKQDSLNQGCVFQRASDFAGDLDEVKRDVFAFEVRDREHGVDRDLGEQAVRF